MFEIEAKFGLLVALLELIYVTRKNRFIIIKIVQG
jgi:hypothetical protein